MDKENILEIYNKFKQFHKTYPPYVWEEFERTLNNIKLDIKEDKNNQIEERIDDYYDFLDFLEAMLSVNKSLDKLSDKEFYSGKKPEYEKLLNSFFPKSESKGSYKYSKIAIPNKSIFIKPEPYVAYYYVGLETHKNLYNSYRFIWFLYHNDVPLITKEQFDFFENFFTETSNYIFEDCWSKNKVYEVKYNIIFIKNKTDEEFVLDEISKQLDFIREVVDRKDELLKTLKTDKRYTLFEYVIELYNMLSDIKMTIVEKQKERKYQSFTDSEW